MTTTDDELTALVLGEGGPNYPGYERRKQIIDALRSELAERTRERDEAEKREHANRVSCEQNFAMLTDEREAHKLAHSQWCAERDAHAETKAGATAPPATTGEPSAVEFAERLRHCIRSGWHNHAIVRELDAFAARAVGRERARWADWARLVLSAFRDGKPEVARATVETMLRLIEKEP